MLDKREPVSIPLVHPQQQEVYVLFILKQKNTSQPKPEWLLLFVSAPLDGNHAFMGVFFFGSEEALSTPLVVPSFSVLLLNDTKDIPLECQSK